MKDDAVGSLRAAADKLPYVGGMRFVVYDATDGRNAQVAYGKESVDYRVRRYENVTTTSVEFLAGQGQAEPQLVFAPAINPTCAERLRKHGIAFLDEAGNCFLRVGALYLFVSQATKGSASVAKPKTKTFGAATLKLVYAFLTDSPGKGQWPLFTQGYREIAARAGISLGAVSNAMEALEAQDFLHQASTPYRLLMNRRQLLERWVQEYARQMRPKMVVGRYRPPRMDWWRDVAPGDLPGLWGGETAGALLTKHLVPETSTLYARDVPATFIIGHDLRKDPAGSVELLRPFWPQVADSPFMGCVHPLVAYADLMASDIDRNLETAKRIHDQFLGSLVTSD